MSNEPEGKGVDTAQVVLGGADDPAFNAAALDKPKAKHWSERIPIWRSIKAIQRQVDSLEAQHQAQLHWHQHQLNEHRERAKQHQSQLMRHQIRLLVQQHELNQQQHQSVAQREELSRQQEQAVLQQEALNRLVDTSELQQEELSRQQEQAVLQQEALNRLVDTSELQQEELNRQQEQAVLQQEELSRQQEQAVLQQEELSRQQEQAVLQQEELSRQQEQAMLQQEELSRQQEQAVLQQEELSRQQEQAVLQQEELSRQQEQAVLQQEELSRQQEQAVLQQGSLNQHQEALNGHRDELDQHLGDIKHSQDQTLGLQNQFQAQHEFTQELEVRFSALARNLGFEHAQNPEFDRWYQNLQDLHRGSGEALAKTQSSYLPYFESLSPLLQPAGPILDLGCGRGEWLSLLARQGWQVRGVDSSELVVEVARENGLDVQLGDLLTLLEAQPANSLAAVTAFQVIEHLPFECIVALVHAAFRALLPGGILLLETPNPENIQVAAYSFWMDPTHKKPIPPPLIMDLSYHAGFRDGLVLRQNPWPNWDQTPAEPSFEGQMNQRLFGPQDYAVLAYKPVTPS